MRFQCDRARLADLLALVAEAAPARAPRPVCQNILIEAAPEGGALLFSATDMEMAIRHRLDPSQLKDPEKVLLPAQRFLSIVRDDRSEHMDVQITGHVAKINTDHFQYTLVGQPPEDFPEIPEMPEDQRVEIAGDDVADAAAKTIFATARAGDTRYALNGVLLVLHSDYCEFVSSDTHRLSCVSKRIGNPDKAEADGIVLTKGLTALARMAAGRETVVLRLTGKMLMASTPDAFLSVRLVEGQFPRYKEVIPSKLEKRIAVNREEISWRLRNLSVMANDLAPVITFETVGDDILSISAEGEAGDGRTELDAVIRGGEVKVAYKCHFLMDLVKALQEDEQVAFQMRDGDTPTRVDSGDFVHVIMPTKP